MNFKLKLCRFFVECCKYLTHAHENESCEDDEYEREKFGDREQILNARRPAHVKSVDQSEYYYKQKNSSINSTTNEKSSSIKFKISR